MKSQRTRQNLKDAKDFDSITVRIFSDELQDLSVGGSVKDAQTAIRSRLGVKNPLRRKFGNSDSIAGISRQLRETSPDKLQEILAILRE